jgi:hypothetical protein
MTPKTTQPSSARPTKAIRAQRPGQQSAARRALSTLVSTFTQNGPEPSGRRAQFNDTLAGPMIGKPAWSPDERAVLIPLTGAMIETYVLLEELWELDPGVVDLEAEIHRYELPKGAAREFLVLSAEAIPPPKGGKVIPLPYLRDPDPAVAMGQLKASVTDTYEPPTRS